MRATEIIKVIMEENSITKTTLARRINVPFQTVYDRLTQKNISVYIILEMLSAMDYELIIRPAGTALRKGEHRVDNGEQSEAEIVEPAEKNSKNKKTYTAEQLTALLNSLDLEN